MFVNIKKVSNRKRKIEIEKPEKFPDFRTEGNRILKFCRAGDELSDPQYSWKLVVPKPERLQKLKRYHDDSAHIGVQKTFERVRQYCYWPKMFEDITIYVTTCEICKKSKISRRSNREPMRSQKRATEAFELVSVDFCGLFPRSKHGNTSLLVICDWYSKFVLCQPITQRKTPLFFNNFNY
jgi:hypothetical protein